MKLKLVQIINDNSINQLNNLAGKSLNPVLAFKLIGILEEVNVLQQKYDKVKLPILKKYGEPNPDDPNGSYKVEGENQKKLLEELNVLLQEEIDFKSELLDMEEFKKQQIEIKPLDLLNIMWIFKNNKFNKKK